jgi:hypothetical protein
VIVLAHKAMTPVYGGPPWTSYGAGAKYLQLAGLGTGSHQEGMGRVRILWGSSPAEYISGRPKDLGGR